MCFFLSGLWSFVSGCREQGTWCWFSRWHRNIRGDAIGAPKMCVHISFHKCLLSTYYVPGPAWSTGTTAANKTEKSIVLAFCTWCTGVFTFQFCLQWEGMLWTVVIYVSFRALSVVWVQTPALELLGCVSLGKVLCAGSSPVKWGLIMPPTGFCEYYMRKCK